MPRLGKWRVLQGVVSAREGPSGSLAMYPAELLVDHLLSRNVMADEIDELSIHSRQYFLKCLQNQRVDQQVIHGGEVRSQCHVV